MKLFDAYTKALAEDEDIAERAEFSSNTELKTMVIEEIAEAMKEARSGITPTSSKVDIIKPLFSCISFWFLIGVRTGKILRDAELASK